jgi:YfiR/HmsC-like
VSRGSRVGSPLPFGATATLLAVMALVSCISVAVARAGVSTVSEYRTKGSYLLNFISLVEWRPPRPIAGVLPVCVFGESPIASMLDQLSAPPIKGRQVLVQRLADLRKVNDCEVLFITEAKWNEVDQIARTLPSGVLTVSEVNTDETVGAIINFVVENDHIVFDVNLAAAAREHVEPTTRLLALARAVDGRRRK